MTNISGYQCIRCGFTMGSGFTGYLCPNCDGRIELLYNGSQAAEQLLADLSGPMKNRLDIFRYRAFLPLESLELTPRLRVGMTPLYPSARLGAQYGTEHLFFKDESGNPSASFKDRASAVVMAKARECGVKVVAGASTGNAGSSMACMSANTGLPCVVFVPASAPVAKLTQLMIFGARVIAVKGSYDEAYDLCYEVTERTGWLNRNTGYNPITREGKKTCGFELWEQCDRNVPDWVIVPCGDGNILGGIYKGFKDLHTAGLIGRIPRLLCAQSENSAAISRTVDRIAQEEQPIDWKKVEIEAVAATTIADSISVDIPRDGLAAVRAVIETDGVAVTVPDEMILLAQNELAAKEGLFVEPAAATAWACARSALMRGLIDKNESVVCVLTGSGLKDVDTARRSIGSPIQIEPDIDAAMQIL